MAGVHRRHVARLATCAHRARTIIFPLSNRREVCREARSRERKIRTKNK